MPKKESVTPQEALSLLKAGNQRYTAGVSIHPNADALRRRLTASEGQHPIATILACSDSRCPVEVLFDQGIGDVFVVRNAGNICGNYAIGSIEYGICHAASPLCVVLGHTGCGAVTAAATTAKVSDQIRDLLKPLDRSLDIARRQCPDAELDKLVDEAVRQNVWLGITDLLTASQPVREFVRAGQVEVVGAVYDLYCGQVEWLGTHPDQARLVMDS